MKTRVRAVFAMVLALLCAGCSHQTARSAFVIDQQREPMSLNAALENGASSTEWGLLLFNYLVKMDDRGHLIGDVATAVPSIANGGISADGKTITYHLRPNVRFADGVRLTARDCVYSIEAVQNPNNNVQTRYGYDRILQAEAPDDTTLVLHLREPFAPILTLVLAPQGFPILPAHLLARYRDFNHLPFNEKPVGAGPYVVRKWYRGDRVEMEANPYYFAGKPSIDRITVRFVADPNTSINQLRTGEADGFFNDEDTGNYPLLANLPGVRTSAVPVNAVGALIFNTSDPLTNDAQLRRAVTEALNVPELVAKTYRGAVNAKDAGRGLFEWAYDPRYPLIAATDLRDARSILDGEGWRVGSSGVRERNGVRLALQMVIQANTPGDEILGSAIQQAERAIGVDLSLKAFQVTQFVAPAQSGGPVYGGKFQLAYYPFVNGDDPDVTDQFACANVPPNGYNKSRFCNVRLDQLMTSARRSYDPPARRARYSAIQQILSEQLPIVLLYQRREIDAFTTRLRGQSTSPSSAFWNVAAWRSP